MALPAGERSRLRRLRAWLASLGTAARLRPRALRPALAVLAELLRPEGTVVDCPAPTAGGALVRLTLQLDGSTYLRFAALDDLAGSGIAAALAALTDRMAGARATLALLRATLDVAVLSATLVATIVLGLTGGSDGMDLARSAAVMLTYGALATLRPILMRAVLRLTLRWASTRLTG